MEIYFDLTEVFAFEITGEGNTFAKIKTKSGLVTLSLIVYDELDFIECNCFNDNGEWLGEFKHCTKDKDCTSIQISILKELVKHIEEIQNGTFDIKEYLR